MEKIKNHEDFWIIWKNGLWKGYSSRYVGGSRLQEVRIFRYYQRGAKKGRNEANKREFEKYGNILRERHGDDFLSKRIYEKILSDGIDKAIICGIMNPGEVGFFRRMEGFKLVWVEATKGMREKR